MTYDEQAQLMTDFTFRNRCKAAMMNFVAYTQSLSASNAGRNTLIEWCRNAQRNPDAAVIQLQPNVVGDPAVQDAGGAVSDEALKGAVENTIKNLL